MKKFKRVCTLLLSACLIVSSGLNVSAATTYTARTQKVSFVQNTATANSLGFVDETVDQYETYSTYESDGISSKIYKPSSGDTMVVVFHGNGEGGVNKVCNNYSQIAANRLAATYSSADIQEKLHGAYVLAFQAPDEWYKDYTDVATAVIQKAKKEFNINQIFVSGLSAGGLMTQRMIVKNPDMFAGALYSCAAIAKNDTAVEGLGGDYTNSTETMECGCSTTCVHKKPTDFDTYKANYTEWLKAIAATNVPIYMIHAKNDPVISPYWTTYAYETITQLRKAAGNTTPVYYKILDTANYGNTSFSEHGAWVKMLNNDVIDSTGTIRPLDFLTGLCTSTNKYTEKEYTLPTAGANKAANTYNFNLVAEVGDEGEVITKAVIDMDGQKVDASKLNKSSFKVTAYGVDASGLLSETTFSAGTLLNGVSEKKPLTVSVKKVYLDDSGNIVLEFKDQVAVLSYTIPYYRNLTVNVKYNIEPVNLTVYEAAAPAQVTLKSVTAGKNKLTITWNKAKNATKYQVAYKKAGATKWTYLTVTAKTGKTVAKLKSGQKYQVKVRGYNTSYGKWSTTKTIKVK
jgi:predicted peptidase